MYIWLEIEIKFCSLRALKPGIICYSSTTWPNLAHTTCMAFQRTGDQGTWWVEMTYDNTLFSSLSGTMEMYPREASSELGPRLSNKDLVCKQEPRHSRHEKKALPFQQARVLSACALHNWKHDISFPPLPPCLWMGKTKRSCPQKLSGEIVLITKCSANVKSYLSGNFVHCSANCNK